MIKRTIVLLLFLSVSISFAQESTEVPVDVTEVPLELREVATAIPTEAVPVLASPELTIEATTPTEVTETISPTEAAPSTETTTPESIVFTPLPEPALSLWASDSFEGAISQYWRLPRGWLGDGTGLTIEGSNTAYFSAETFSEVAIQAQFRLSAGARASLFVRNGYRASLSSEGRISLWRDETELATSTITLNPEGHFLRLSAFGDTLRLGLDGQTMLIAQDTTYSIGQVGVGFDFSQAGTGRLDNFGVWIPTSMMTPTPAVPIVVNSPHADVNIQALIAPNLFAPALNGVIPRLRPTFSWQARTGATQYHLRIATNFSCSTPFTNEIFDGNVYQTGTTFTPSFDIPQGEYWFCVEAKDINNQWSDFGEKRRFVINLSTAPLNQAVIFGSSVALRWTAVAGASYVVEVSPDSSFSIVTPYTPATASLLLTGQSYGQYFWRVTINGVPMPQVLARSYYLSPALPYAVTVAAPLINNAFTNDTSPVLNWTVPTNWRTPALGQSITYELQLSTVYNFSTLLAGASVIGISSNSYEWTTTSLTDGLYYWRVRAVTNLGLAGAWSAAFYFRVDTVPQAAPIVVSLLDLTVIRTARPSFYWQVASGARYYLLEVTSDNSGYDPLLINSRATTTARTATTSLPQGQYFWRVWSEDAAGNYSLLPSTERSFIVDYRVNPIEQQIFVSSIPRAVGFSWALVTGASGAIYSVDIANDEDFMDIEHSSPLLSAGAWTSPALSHGRYYWRLSVIGYGVSEARSFVISPLLPNAPAILNPIHGFVTSDLSPTLEWNLPTISGADVVGYELQISRNKSFTALVYGTLPIALSSYTISPDLPSVDGSYYWRVRAVTDLGAKGAWSIPRIFAINVP